MMGKVYGYGGMLTVNLSNEKITKEPISEDLIENWVGGEGFCMRLLWERVKPAIDPLSPENVLIFSPGVLVGSIFPGATKTSVGFKSPLTGGVGTCTCGGYFGPSLKFAGYDLLVIEGKAERPVYLYIEDGLVEIRDASHLWGKLLTETDEMLKKEIGPDVRMVRIGPAGEGLLREANIMAGWSAFGRGGAGAVMGSKNLKAIAVITRGGLPQYDPDGMIKVHDRATKFVSENFFLQAMKQDTIYAILQPVIAASGLEVRHFQEEGDPEKWKIYFPENIYKELDTKVSEGCFGCDIKCHRVLWPKKGPYKGHKCASKSEAPVSWGTNVCLEDLDIYQEILYRLAENGLDINGPSEWAAWLAECQEKGVLTPEDTGGLEVKFGDGESFLKLIDMTIKREGFGDIMAEGVKIASERLGKGSEKCACLVKGMGIEGEVYRADKMQMLSTSVSERGGNAIRPWTWFITHGSRAMPGGEAFLLSEVTGLKSTPPHAREEKGFAKWFRAHKCYYYGAQNCLGVCTYYALVGFPYDMMKEAYRSLSGRELSIEDSLKLGDRIMCIQRAFNWREGIGRKDDFPPEKFLTEPMHGGPMDGNKVENWDAMLDELYTECGFDLETGCPTRAKLEEIGLKDVADGIY
jgi:aldehyde:ferredoxin oxidoreductase